MNLLTSKEIEQYIDKDKTYVITFLYNGNIFTNNIEHIHKVNDNMLNHIQTKLKNHSHKYEINKFQRDMYFSQIRDKNDKTEKIYYNNYNFIMEFNLYYKMYLIELQYKTCDKLSFPNLNKYHYSSKVEQKILKIENINLIIENNNILIEFKNPNFNTLCDIINTIVSFRN
jgi:hypothetical protein